MSVEWNGDEVERQLRARLSRNMRQAALYVKGQVQRSINRGNADGSDPSAPGESPKKVTARLFQSIATDQRESPLEITGVVGTNVEYAKRLEYGFTGTERVSPHTRLIKSVFGRKLPFPMYVNVGGYSRNVDQAPRPFLRPGLADNLPAIRRILARG